MTDVRPDIEEVEYCLLADESLEGCFDRRVECGREDGIAFP
jgi:hypothetical protein